MRKAQVSSPLSPLPPPQFHSWVAAASLLDPDLNTLLLYCELGLLHKCLFLGPRFFEACVMGEDVCLHQPAPQAGSVDKNVTTIQEVPALCLEAVWLIPEEGRLA